MWKLIVFNASMIIFLFFILLSDLAANSYIFFDDSQSSFSPSDFLEMMYVFSAVALVFLLVSLYIYNKIKGNRRRWIGLFEFFIISILLIAYSLGIIITTFSRDASSINMAFIWYLVQFFLGVLVCVSIIRKIIIKKNFLQ